MSRPEKRYKILSIVRDTIASHGEVNLHTISQSVECAATTVQWHMCNLIKEGLLTKRNDFIASVVPTPAGWAWEKPVKEKPVKLKPYHVCRTERFGTCTHCRAEQRRTAYKDNRRDWKMAR